MVIEFESQTFQLVQCLVLDPLIYPKFPFSTSMVRFRYKLGSSIKYSTGLHLETKSKELQPRCFRYVVLSCLNMDEGMDNVPRHKSR